MRFPSGVQSVFLSPDASKTPAFTPFRGALCKLGMKRISEDSALRSPLVVFTENKGGKILPADLPGKSTTQGRARLLSRGASFGTGERINRSKFSKCLLIMFYYGKIYNNNSNRR